MKVLDYPFNVVIFKKIRDKLYGWYYGNYFFFKMKHGIFTFFFGRNPIIGFLFFDKSQML
jgi:hypothetical protein